MRLDTSFLIILTLPITPDDFTYQGENAATQWVISVLFQPDRFLTCIVIALRFTFFLLIYTLSLFTVISFTLLSSTQHGTRLRIPRNFVKQNTIEHKNKNEILFCIRLQNAIPVIIIKFSPAFSTSVVFLFYIKFLFLGTVFQYPLRQFPISLW